MTPLSRRSFLATSAAAAAAGTSVLGTAQETRTIPGFDQTQTDYDRTQEWKPFSDRKIRVGIVGHGVCKFGLEFGLQHHPNVELVAVSDPLPEMPLFLTPEVYVQVPLEPTYQQAWDGMPAYWREVIERGEGPS